MQLRRSERLDRRSVRGRRRTGGSAGGAGRRGALLVRRLLLGIRLAERVLERRVVGPDQGRRRVLSRSGQRTVDPGSGWITDAEPEHAGYGELAPALLARQRAVRVAVAYFSQSGGCEQCNERCNTLHACGIQGVGIVDTDGTRPLLRVVLYPNLGGRWGTRAFFFFLKAVIV